MSVNTKNSTGKQYKTTESQRRYMARRRQDPEYRAHMQAYMKEYRLKNRTRMLVQEASYRKENSRRLVLQKRGIDEVTYDSMLAKQGGVCAICGGLPQGRWKMYCVDHNHKTDTLRGLLCNSCNLGLGKFLDDPEILDAAARYLRSYQ